MSTTYSIPVSSDPLLKSLADAVAENDKKDAWCSGTWKVPAESLNLFFATGNNDIVQRIKFPGATIAQLDELVNACQVATFGVNQKDVLDESYRKASKMDAENFAMNFSPESSGLASAVKSQLLDWKDETRDIALEVYKLNVYGKDSFFKIHRDTPRSENMFGSLVVVLPTPHVGGGLLLRGKDREMLFDSAKVLDGKPAGTIAYAAFYSDVEHEVQKVLSGHRVTVTYNLYFARPPTLPMNPESNDPFLQVLAQNLADPQFLPNGGHLGFGLKHQYPVQYEHRELSHPQASLDALKSCLKGTDAAIARACTQLGLDAVLMIIYEIEGSFMMFDSAVNLEGINYMDPVESLIDRGGIMLEGSAYSDDRGMMVSWVTPMTAMNGFGSNYIAYGNDHALGYAYGIVSFIVSVGRPGKRQDHTSIIPSAKRPWMS